MVKVEFELTEENAEILGEYGEKCDLDRDTVFNIAIDSALEDIEQYTEQNNISLTEAFAEVLDLEADQ